MVMTIVGPAPTAAVTVTLAAREWRTTLESAPCSARKSAA
jgi:hypothetical protein